MDAIDFLTCGRCQAEFPLSSIVVFMQHKKSDCSSSDHELLPPVSEARYTCFACYKKFNAAISLLFHVQYQHKRMIFRDKTNGTDALPLANGRESSAKDTEVADEHKESTEGNSAAADVAQPLSKCCSAVVPKKRKRHIETKHKFSAFKSKLRWQQQRDVTSDIYIDLDQNSSDGNPMMDGSSNQSVLLEPGSTFQLPISGGKSSSQFFGISYSGASTTTQTSPPVPSQIMAPAADAKTNLVPAAETAVSTGKRRRSNYSSAATKPFKCDYCDHSFNQRIHLKKHLSKHTGVKPYKCGHCDYATVERSHLKVHIRIHTGEKPFKCNHCEYATAQNSTLKIHLKRHHGKLMLECSHCGMSFPEKTQLNNHTKVHNSLPSLNSQPPQIDPEHLATDYQAALTTQPPSIPE